MDEKEEGTIAYLNEKGYGFIEIPTRTKSVFFHAKDIKNVSFDKVQKGDRVEIEGVKETEKGFNARGVFVFK